MSIAEVWQIVERDLPGLKKSISAVLPPLEQLEKELAGEYEEGKSEMVKGKGDE